MISLRIVVNLTYAMLFTELLLLALFKVTGSLQSKLQIARCFKLSAKAPRIKQVYLF